MRIRSKTFVCSLLVVGLMLGISASQSFADVKAIQDTTLTSWTNKIWYLAHVTGPDAPYDDVTVYITAVDKFKLYINGERVSGKGPDEWDGKDDDWSTVEEYKLPDSQIRSFVIGVEVVNSGTGIGNGIMMDIKAGSDWLGTSIMKRRSHVNEVDHSRTVYPSKWFYYDGFEDGVRKDITEVSWAEGAEWYKLKYNTGKNETILDDTNVQKKLGEVLSGSMGDIDHIYDPNIKIVTGYKGDVDLGSAEGGGIMLRRVEGQNLALGKPAEEDKITDGDPTQTYFQYNQDPLGSTRYIDLEKVYRVNEMVIYTGGSDPNRWSFISVRGYSCEISLDKYRWEEVNVIHEIGISNEDEGGYDWASVTFPDEWARYLRFKITEPRIDFPAIGEVMVYGVGYNYEGEFESDWLDFGTPNVQKNFKSIIMDVDIKPGTHIKFQTKTGYYDANDNLVESTWSSLYNALGDTLELDSPEPSSMVKYRVMLETEDIKRSPILKSLTFSYSEVDQPVASADGFIIPASVPMAKDTTFVYTLSYLLNSGQNLKSIELSMPSYATLNYIYSTDLGDTVSIKGSPTRTSDLLSLELENDLTDTNADGVADSLYISFNTKLLANIHNFDAWLYNSTNSGAKLANDGAGGVKVWENRDMGTKTVMTSTITGSLLTNVRAIPKVFTPNNDGKNDFAVIEFVLSIIDVDLKIKIFNTRGSLVTTIYDDVCKSGDQFVLDKRNTASIGQAKTMPGYWDGTDEDGDLVPPGVYIYQVIADTDEGSKVESGTVVVGY
ncbi:MAG: hypothetical protein HOC71_07505 [Candidatus Latescibacteria bacterium]|nr:hypothetical protein [Candidatus Latescibacterota bacterium]